MCGFCIISHYLISNVHHTFVLCQFIKTYASTTQTQFTGSSEMLVTHYKTTKCHIQVFLFIYVLFSDAVSIFEYIVSDDRMNGDS